MPNQPNQPKLKKSYLLTYLFWGSQSLSDTLEKIKHGLYHVNLVSGNRTGFVEDDNTHLQSLFYSTLKPLLPNSVALTSRLGVNLSFNP